SADKIRSDLAAGEEFPVDRVVVEARHWPAIESNRPRRDNEVTALQAAVAEGRRFGEIRLVDEPGACVDVREQPRQPIIELGVEAEDRCDWRGQYLLAVALEAERDEAL